MDFIAKAAEVTKLKIIEKPDDVQRASHFSPEFLHQFFGDDGIIQGYRNLSVELMFTASTFHSFCKISFHDKQDKALDILKAFQDKVPSCGMTANIDEFLCHLNEPFTPPGTKVREYQTPGKPDIFEIYRGNVTDPAVARYHRRLQLLPFLFIDCASMIELDDPKWEVFYLFRRGGAGEPAYAFVGMVTVYILFRFPDKTRWRISQVIVLPPHQRRGHACFLLDTIYKQARLSQVVDITVESPSQDMARVRTLVDCLLCQQLGLLQFRRDILPTELSPDMVQAVQEKLPLIDAQIRKCYEVFKWRALDRSDEMKYYAFRIEVKRRLLKQNEEELAGIAREERIPRLKLIYQQTEEEYARLSDALTKHRTLLR